MHYSQSLEIKLKYHETVTMKKKKSLFFFIQNVVDLFYIQSFSRRFCPKHLTNEESSKAIRSCGQSQLVQHTYSFKEMYRIEGVRLVCEVFQADIVLHFSLRRTALQYETDSAPALQSAVTHHQRESTRPSHFEPTQNPVLFKLSYFQSLQRCFVSRVCNGSICLLSGLYIFIMRAERNLAIKLCINQLELRQIHIWLLLGLRLK